MQALRILIAIASFGLALGIVPAGAGQGAKQPQVSSTARSDETLSSRGRRHLRVYEERWFYDGPQACSSVMFPRSPQCAHIPPRFSPYGDSFPWVSF
jgi:hypothetical protein